LSYGFLGGIFPSFFRGPGFAGTVLFASIAHVGWEGKGMGIVNRIRIIVNLD
jgi:hypothetical protein